MGGGEAGRWKESTPRKKQEAETTTEIGTTCATTRPKLPCRALLGDFDQTPSKHRRNRNVPRSAMTCNGVEQDGTPWPACTMGSHSDKGVTVTFRSAVASGTSDKAQRDRRPLSLPDLSPSTTLLMLCFKSPMNQLPRPCLSDKIPPNPPTLPGDVCFNTDLALSMKQFLKFART